MPIEVGIWRINDGPQRVTFSALESEARLETVLEQDLSVLSPNWLLIGRQVPTAQGKLIDLLAMDADGNLVIIELKRNRTPREVVAQLLDYASWAQALDYQDLSAMYTEHHGKAFEEGFFDTFDSSPPDKLNEQHRLVLVAAELDPASERIINYLSDNYGVPINAVFFRYFKDGASEYLTRTWLIDPQEVEAKASASGPQKGKEPWNGQDFHANFGEGPRRNWDDGRRYGFISGGGGRWYSRSLEQLSPGHRVFVLLPGTGYVGVAKVLAPAVPATEFTVDVDGVSTPILQAPLTVDPADLTPDDPDKTERFVRVEWLKTLPRDQAIWEKGMYGNQNTVTKLRNRFTLERLIERFGLEDD
jgi:hypothetical protein